MPIAFACMNIAGHVHLIMHTIRYWPGIDRQQNQWKAQRGYVQGMSSKELLPADKHMNFVEHIHVFLLTRDVSAYSFYLRIFIFMTHVHACMITYCVQL